MYIKFSAFALALLPFTHATLEFANNGTLSDLPPGQPKPEHKGTITQSTNIFLSPPSSIKVTQTYDSSYSGRYHSEAVYPKGYKRGQTKYYGFAFRLSDQWDFEGSQSYNIAQWIADFGDTKCDDWSPTSMVYLRGSTLFSRVKTGQLLPGKPCPPEGNKGDCSGGKNCQKTREFELQKGIKGGEWYRVVFGVKWEADSSGFFDTWINGQKVHGEEGIPTTLMDDKREFSFRVGLYANGWHDEGKLVGGQGTRQVWVDDMQVGSEMGDIKFG